MRPIRSSILGAIASMGLLAAGPRAVHIGPDTLVDPDVRHQRRVLRRQPKISGFDPKINRWTGKPHEHKREIARRERQEVAQLAKGYTNY